MHGTAILITLKQEKEKIRIWNLNRKTNEISLIPPSVFDDKWIQKIGIGTKIWSVKHFNGGKMAFTEIKIEKMPQKIKNELEKYKKKEEKKMICSKCPDKMILDGEQFFKINIELSRHILGQDNSKSKTVPEINLCVECATELSKFLYKK